jgi:type III secretion system FlhB-like substrate exporter
MSSITQLIPTMKLAQAVTELPADDFIVKLIDAEREIERRIISLLEKLYRPHIADEDDMKIAEKIAQLESALNIAIKCRLQLEAARRIGTNTYKTVAEIIAPALARVDKALAEP